MKIKQKMRNRPKTEPKTESFYRPKFKPGERCRCGSCGRILGHLSLDDYSCNNPKCYAGDKDPKIKICDTCRETLRDA